MFDPHSKVVTYRYNRVEAIVRSLCYPILATALCLPNPAFAQTLTAVYATATINCNISGGCHTPPSNTVTDKNSSAVVNLPLQSDNTSGQTVEGFISAGPGQLASWAKVNRPDNMHGSTWVLPAADRYDHFRNNNRANLGAMALLTLRLVGTVLPTTRPLFPGGSGIASAKQTVELYVNKQGTPWYPTINTPCPLPPTPPTSNNCLEAVEGKTSHTINSTGDSFSIDLTATQDVASGSIPSVDFLVPILQGFDYTIHSRFEVSAFLLGAGAPTQLELEFSHTADVYLDSPDDSDLVLEPENNHDYSDPSRYTSKSTAKSDVANRPIFPKTVADPKHKLIGGGAQIRGTGAAALTGSSPLSASSIVPPDTAPVAWLADGSGNSVTSYGIQLNDPSNLYKVVVTQSDNGFGLYSRPTARAVVPSGYALVGGGCQIKTPNSQIKTFDAPRKTSQNNNFVTGSFPDETEPTPKTWICESQTQRKYNPGVITAYAVGIAPRSVGGADTPTVRITKAADTGPFQPTATANVFGPGFIVTGCGARVTDTLTHAPPPPSGLHLPTYQPQYEFLTAILPVLSSGSANDPVTACQAAASDLGTHHTGGNLTTFTISASFQTAKLTSLLPNMIRAVNGFGARFLFFEGDHFYPSMLVGFIPGSGPLSVTSSTPVASLWMQYSNYSAHHGAVSVPLGLPPGDYMVGVVQGDVLSGSLPFTVFP
jgi:hypothetical protein